MVSVVVAPPRGDPCGEVPGADFGELPRLPQCLEKKTAAGLAQYFYAITIQSRISAGPRTVDGA
eukprot:1358820-Prymnesium_polylepis.1